MKLKKQTLNQAIDSGEKDVKSIISNVFQDNSLSKELDFSTPEKSLTESQKENQNKSDLKNSKNSKPPKKTISRTPKLNKS